MIETERDTKVEQRQKKVFYLIRTYINVQVIVTPVAAAESIEALEFSFIGVHMAYRSIGVRDVKRLGKDRENKGCLRASIRKYTVYDYSNVAVNEADAGERRKKWWGTAAKLRGQR